MEPSRFWLRRDDNDQARQVVYDKLQLGLYSDRQRRAIEKVMARGKTASHRDIRRAARRARDRSRGEILVAISVALSALAVIVIILAGGHRGSTRPAAIGGAAAGVTGVRGTDTPSQEDLTGVIEKADLAWLKDVGAGKVASANDGSDVLSLPQVQLRDDASTAAATRAPRTKRGSSRPQRRRTTVINPE